jgi:hypothetical protein
MWVITRTDEKRVVNLAVYGHVMVRAATSAAANPEIVAFQRESDPPVVLARCESAYQAEALFQRLTWSLQNEVTILDLSRDPEVEEEPRAPGWQPVS